MDFKALLGFLKKLKTNNTKEWFEKNRPVYEVLRKDFIDHLQVLIQELGKKDIGISDIEAKKAVFRMNRDIRFSKDKSPYKTNFGASFKPDGKKSNKAGYYLHIEPGKSFLAGGLYLPQPKDLQAVREEIDYDAKPLHTIINNKNFKKYFKAIEGEKLKNPPKGFQADHEDIDLLKFKSFLMMHPLNDEDVYESGFFKNSISVYSAMIPFNQFLNQAISHEK